MESTEVPGVVFSWIKAFLCGDRETYINASSNRALTGLLSTGFGHSLHGLGSLKTAHISKRLSRDDKTTTMAQV